METRASAETFSEGGVQQKTRPKNSKKGRKIALLCLLREGGATEKRPKNSKKDQKTALFSLYLQNLHHV